jgi:hypothetical protein
MTGFLEDSMLRFEGLDDADIAALNAALADMQAIDQAIEAQWPAILKLVAAFAPLWPRLSRCVTSLSPIIDKIIAKQKELKP